MDNAESKKNFFYITILILTLIIVIIGAAFAIYNFLHSQKEGSSTVYTGTLAVEYLSGNIINFNPITPRRAPNYETEENVYKNKFRVKNIGTLEGIISVYIELNNNEFKEESLKYKLFNSEGEELITGNIPKEGEVEIAKNILLAHDTITEFTLIIWLEENDKNQNEEMRKKLSGIIRIDANQRKD